MLRELWFQRNGSQTQLALFLNIFQSFYEHIRLLFLSLCRRHSPIIGKYGGQEPNQATLKHQIHRLLEEPQASKHIRCRISLLTSSLLNLIMRYSILFFLNCVKSKHESVLLHAIFLMPIFNPWNTDIPLSCFSFLSFAY